MTSGRLRTDLVRLLAAVVALVVALLVGVGQGPSGTDAAPRTYSYDLVLQHAHGHSSGNVAPRANEDDDIVTDVRLEASNVRFRSGAEDGPAVTFRSDTSHIFRDAPGHLLDDTPANRSLLQGAVTPENLVGTNQWGISTYQELLPDGRQVWVEVRNGTTITNGGVNNVPRP